MTRVTGSRAFQYYAFISYSHQDKLRADWLHKTLETYAVPKRLVGQRTTAGPIPRRLTPIFRDRDELASAHDLGRKVNEALAQSANLIVICSPRSAASPWVQEEVLAYKRLGRAERIFCLIVDGEPNASELPGREAEECFVPALRFELDADGQPTAKRAEPIAADARAGKDGKSNAKLKLIAGMLEVGFDALKQRELRRRARRMTAVAALALVVMIVTSVLAVVALISRHDAVIAQRTAVVAQKAAIVAQQSAERRQKQAEGLVGFMLGDLGDKLQQVNRLDILQAVDDKAMTYFNSLPTADATDSALALRVTALEKIASVRMDRGQTLMALKPYRAAAALAAELVRRAPHNEDRETAYGDSLKWVGQAYWRQGDLSNALKNFQTAIELLQKAHSARPDEDDLTFKLATARNDAGHVLETRGELGAAHGDYTTYLQIFQSLHQREPANPKWRSYLGDAWDNLGKIELEQGHLDRAIADYAIDQRLKAEIVAQDPANHDAIEDLLVSNAILGRTLALSGNMVAALSYTREAVNSAKKESAYDSAYAYMQEDTALYSQQLGGLLRQTRQLGAAGTADSEALSIFAGLVVKDKSNTGWHREYAQAQIEMARLKLQLGNTATAQALSSVALQGINTLRVQHSPDPTLSLLAAQANLLQGRIDQKNRDTAAARSAWTRAIAILEPASSMENDPNDLALTASAWLLLNEIGKARPLIGKLAAMGYRTPDFDALLAIKGITYAVSRGPARRIASTTPTQTTPKANP